MADTDNIEINSGTSNMEELYMDEISAMGPLDIEEIAENALLGNVQFVSLRRAWYGSVR
jgi:hypothetical protein